MVNIIYFVRRWKLPREGEKVDWSKGKEDEDQVAVLNKVVRVGDV